MADKNWAAKQLLDPLNTVQPADEDGPGSHFGNSLAGVKTTGSPSKPGRQSVTGYPTPPQSASPKRSAFPDYRADAFNEKFSPSPRQSSEIPTSPTPSRALSNTSEAHARRRVSSLSARYPGDQSHRPLDIIRAEQRAANRTRRRSHVGADTIDRLDMIGASGIAFHHDGPYDATLLARNLSFNSSPVAAVQTTNEEALRATPQEFINDSIRRHRPLAGTASIPPGTEDRFGRVLSYREGPNLNTEMGWRRWEGIEYHPDDIKGKGEPNFTLDRAFKNHKTHRRVISEGGIELRDRSRGSPRLIPISADDEDMDEEASNRTTAKVASGVSQLSLDGDSQFGGLRRANTTGRRTSAMASSLRSKFGSLRRRKHVDGAPLEY